MKDYRLGTTDRWSIMIGCPRFHPSSTYWLFTPLMSSISDIFWYCFWRKTWSKYFKEEVSQHNLFAVYFDHNRCQILGSINQNQNPFDPLWSIIINLGLSLQTTQHTHQYLEAWMVWYFLICYVCVIFQHGKAAVYSVAWNQKDSKRIATCGADGYWWVQRVKYMPVCPGQVKKILGR